MILSTHKNCTRLLIVLQLVLFSFAANTPLLHAHEFGHGSDKHHSHTFFGAHSDVDHVDDHDHEDNILGEEFDFANGFHTHDSNTHTHFLEDILSLTSVNKRSRLSISLLLRDFLIHYELLDNTEIKDFHLFKKPIPPRYKDKIVVLSFTSLPPPKV